MTARSVVPDYGAYGFSTGGNEPMSPTGGGWDTGDVPLNVYQCSCHHEPHAAPTRWPSSNAPCPDPAAHHFEPRPGGYAYTADDVWDDMLAELSESPLSGARYAYEVVKRRRATLALPSYDVLHEPQVICGVCQKDVFVDEDGDAWHRVEYEEMFGADEKP